MNVDMKAETTCNYHNKAAVFMQQMIPHHANAVSMAKLLLKTEAVAVAGVEDLEDVLHSIINIQNYQIHQFRNYLGGLPAHTEDCPVYVTPANAVAPVVKSHGAYDGAKAAILGLVTATAWAFHV